MTFHRAPPDANGLGVITSMPGLVRSAHDLMFFGLPLRTTMTTTESVIIPLAAPAFQSVATRLAFTRRVMSGSRENATMSAVCPAATARLWSPDPPKDSVKVVSLPWAVCWNALVIFSYAAWGVEYATMASSAAGSGAPPAAADPSVARSVLGTSPEAFVLSPPHAANVTTLMAATANPSRLMYRSSCRGGNACLWAKDE